jgi:hypothetical protein
LDAFAMTLDEFLAAAPQTLALFAARTRELAKTDRTMNPNIPRAEEWWWRDVGAYVEYVELEEKARRQND